MQGSAAPQLSVTDLACRRGDRLLFRGLSFALGSGEALHITGANGTGKTTLIRTVAGLVRPYAGAITCEGGIGLLDERPALDPDWPLGKALTFWNRIDERGFLAQESCADRMGLTDLLDIPVRYLSTGQKKRAALSVLLARNIPIWLLDEPLSGLDTGAIEQTNMLIQRRLEDGGIALIASHQSLALPGLKTLAIEDFAPVEETSA